jgi:hypothetical protein
MAQSGGLIKTGCLYLIHSSITNFQLSKKLQNIMNHLIIFSDIQNKFH